jgi:POT family proton-dependent oligopeptide transporter
MRVTERAESVATPSLLSRRRWPPQVKYIIGNEGCERFSFYGMRSILVVYMVQDLLLAQHDAKALFHFFVFASYFATLGGAWLADRFAGRYRTVLWLSAGYVAGHAVIASFESREGLYAGLALIAVGSGGIKPCVSAFVGDQFRADDQPFLAKVYSLFYWIVNLGSASSNLLIPVLRREFGPRLAFAVPGVLMAIALLVFWAGRRHYVVTPPTGPNPSSFLRVSEYAIRRIGTGRLGDHWLDVARDRFPAEAVVGTRAVYRILGVFAATFTFWALFDQHSSSWVLQAGQMDLKVLGHRLDPAQPSALNPFLILAMIPFFSGFVYPRLSQRGLRVTPLGKMTVGMFLTALSFVAATAVQLAIDHGAQPSIVWQLPQYLLLTSGEVLVSITGLEFAYTQAPDSMKSTIMSLWFVSVALGNLLTAWVSALNTFRGAAYFAFFAAIMLAGAFAFRAVARRYRPVELSPVALSDQ